MKAHRQQNIVDISVPGYITAYHFLMMVERIKMSYVFFQLQTLYQLMTPHMIYKSTRKVWTYTYYAHSVKLPVMFYIFHNH